MPCRAKESLEKPSCWQGIQNSNRLIQIHVTRTYLQLNDPEQFIPAFGNFPELTVECSANPVLYRQCYRTVGAAHRWIDRWGWTDEEIQAHLEKPEITFHVAIQNDSLAGWYELRRVDDGSVEIAYFGLVPGKIGIGLGKHLLSCAVRDAWALRPGHVWLHTCTLDHSHALPNYLKRGFLFDRAETYTVDSAK